MQILTRMAFGLKLILHTVLPFSTLSTVHNVLIYFGIANNVFLHVLTNTLIVDRSFFLYALGIVDIGQNL